MSARPFISYAHDDRDLAMTIRDDLIRLGASPWIDIVDLRAGEEWQPAISAALHRCSHALILLSRHYVTKRGYVQKEVRQAIEMLDEFPPASIFLIPVRLDECEPAHSRLKTLHWVNLFEGYDEGLRKIANSLVLARRRSLLLLKRTLNHLTIPLTSHTGVAHAGSHIEGVADRSVSFWYRRKGS